MAETLARTECSIESVTNNEKSIKLSYCRKCAEIAQQLHYALNKSSSAQLIIELFDKEHNHDSMDTAISQLIRSGRI
jgi:hypothetical protein